MGGERGRDTEVCDDGKVPRIKGKSHAYLGEYAVVQGGELPTRR